jgi:predicted glycosyltransferase
MSRQRPRILLYSHDTFGLGHLRRTLGIAERVAGDWPQASQLLITGSMVAGAFGLPPHLDLIKLPALSKKSSGKYKARALPLSLAQTIHWREQMILQAVQCFEPDLVLVDKTPAGVEGELLPTIRYLKSWCPHVCLVLGMRDIEDAPAATRAEWDANGTRSLHEEIYDRILLYGWREVFDPIDEYGMSDTVAAKVEVCGYLGREISVRPAAAVRRELNAGERPLIVVTAGGGGDGYELLKSFMDSRALSQPVDNAHCLVVTGPLMAQGKRRLLQQTSGLENLTVLEFTPDLLSYLAAADLIVSMAGYNTVCEALTLGARLLLVPRVRPRAEQQIRAERLAALGLARVLLPERLTPERLAHEIDVSLNTPRAAVTLDLNGLARVSRAIGAILEGAPAAPLPETPPIRNGHVGSTLQGVTAELLAPRKEQQR